MFLNYNIVNYDVVIRTSPMYRPLSLWSFNGVLNVFMSSTLCQTHLLDPVSCSPSVCEVNVLMCAGNYLSGKVIFWMNDTRSDLPASWLCSRLLALTSG